MERKNFTIGIICIVIATALVAVLIFFQGDAEKKEKTADNEVKKEQAVGAMPETNENLPIGGTVTTASGKIVRVRVATTPKQRELGLSYFESLQNDEGMLFVFENSGRYPFWMKGMNFPLDIIWLKSAAQGYYGIVHVAKNAQPSSYPDVIDPKVDADAVLEIPGGLSDSFGIKEGSVLQIQK